MKILHVTPILGPSNGGSAVIPLNLANEQVKRNNEVTILTSDYQLDETIRNSSNGVRVKSFECGRLFKSSFYTPGLYDWLKSNGKDYDVIHLHNFRSYQSIIVDKFSKKYGIPYIVQAHGSAKIVGGKESSKRAFDLFWGRNIINDAYAFIAVTKMEVEHYLSLGASITSIYEIPNALSTTNSSKLPVKGEFRKRFGIADDAEVILFVGRLNKIKGVDLLIRAFAHLRDERKNAVLVIAGPDDGEENNLREMVKFLGLEKWVKFVGFMSDPTSAYADTNVLAYPSQYEIFGLVPFEAIWYGSPVVVSSENGCGDIISRVGCGLTFSSRDELALSDSIRFLLDHQAEGESMVQKGRNYIRKNLTWEIVVGEFDRVYDDVLNRAGRKCGNTN